MEARVQFNVLTYSATGKECQIIACTTLYIFDEDALYRQGNNKLDRDKFLISLFTIFRNFSYNF